MKQCNNCGIDIESYDEVFRSPELEAVSGTAQKWEDGNTYPLCERDFTVDDNGYFNFDKPRGR